MQVIYFLYLSFHYRGYKIPVIENLGAALDQYDTIDFSDNEIRKLDGFPFMNRVKSLMMNNNRIVRVAEGLELSLPNINTLILTNNSLQVNTTSFESTNGNAVSSSCQKSYVIALSRQNAL